MPAVEWLHNKFPSWHNLHTPLPPSSRITTSTGLPLNIGSKPHDPCYFSHINRTLLFSEFVVVRYVLKFVVDVAGLETKTLNRNVKQLIHRPKSQYAYQTVAKHSSTVAPYLQIQLQYLFLKIIYFMNLLFCAIWELHYKKLYQFKQLIHSLKPKEPEFNPR
jgi:hypothetical protein